MPEPALPDGFSHTMLPSGVELAVDRLPGRQTVAIVLRMLTTLADEPAELAGLHLLVERTLSKGTQRFDGRGLADAFDAIGVRTATATGRQSIVVRVLCLPEFVGQTLALLAELLCRPSFPDEACRVAVELAQQDLKHLDDDPQDILRIMIQELTLGPVFGRHLGGTAESLARITPDAVRRHWAAQYRAGRLQVAAAGPLDPARLSDEVEAAFAGLGQPGRSGRDPLDYSFTPARAHRDKDLQQQYIALTLPGVPKGHADFAVEQILLGVLSGGMGGRLFTEVREKLGLVYWVGAWHEQLRGAGVIHLGASSTPKRCHKTYDTLLRELRRLGDDLTPAEVERARVGLLAHHQTEDDQTRARAASLSDDLFHFGRPIGPDAKNAALAAVTREQVCAYARQLPRERLCVATLGPRRLAEM